MHIVLFSGSFSPFHNGHFSLVKELIERKEVDQVWISVTPLNPHKSSSDLWPLDFRKLLVREVYRDCPNVFITEIEETLSFPLYTYNTLKALQESYTENTFSLLVGGDNFHNFNTWYNAENLLREFTLYIFPRETDIQGSTTFMKNKGIHWLNVSTIDISSTIIRKKIENGEQIKDLVPSCIEQKIVSYIKI
ncbi:nicotinate (nicotinamide) nucleotide adenylyltransferase [Halosquirtibacter laminarini]|uniref:Nicotinate (Nicotinamide) nucleotide adenylyltransferase n=1 Tax=Halosquirtibacter laminarini TaxID=3374600 RepID=A0AC61NG01_9BACT|nr:nicotinate (nicotinamide) nucleotide adenylyltransferase [Prolixibacteraceae bacterium]